MTVAITNCSSRCLQHWPLEGRLMGFVDRTQGKILYGVLLGCERRERPSDMAKMRIPRLSFLPFVPLYNSAGGARSLLY